MYVYSQYGTLIQESTKTKKLHNKFLYVLSTLHDYVDIYAECDPETPYYKWDGEILSPGYPYRQYIRHPVEHVMVSCAYKHPRWTGGSEILRTYLIKLEKPEATDLEYLFDTTKSPCL